MNRRLLGFVCLATGMTIDSPYSRPWRRSTSERRDIAERVLHVALSLTIASAALAVLIAASPLARAMTMPAASGQTKVDASPVACHVAISAPVNGAGHDYHLNNNPDTVRMPYDVNWGDQRSGPGLSRAYHNFTLDTEHLGTPGPHAEKRATTTGGSGSVTLWSNVTNVYNGQYVNITFSASLSVTSGGIGCPASDSFTLSYHYVYP
jgi:hypothetical protein